MNCFRKIKCHANILAVYCNNVANTKSAKLNSNEIMFMGKTAKYKAFTVVGPWASQHPWSDSNRANTLVLGQVNTHDLTQAGQTPWSLGKSTPMIWLKQGKHLGPWASQHPSSDSSRANTFAAAMDHKFVFYFPIEEVWTSIITKQLSKHQAWPLWSLCLKCFPHKSWA